MNPKDQEYADALNEISRKVAAGEMSEGEATVWRQRLNGEMARRHRPAWQTILIVLAVVIVGILIMRGCVAVAGYGA